VLIAQHHSLETDRAFLESLLPFFNDSRYIRIDGKPLLLIYRINLLPEAAKTIELWRTVARQYGFPDIYVAAARAFDVDNLNHCGVDAAVEFPPHQVDATDITKSKTVINLDFQGIIYDYNQVASRFGKREWNDIVTFKTVFPSWDNEARRPGRARIFAGSDPLSYAGWLRDACTVTASRPNGERLIFINAWNEWAEGAHLEPDREFGYAYLHATSSVLRNYYSDGELDIFISENNARFTKRSERAIVFHCYHEDIVGEIVEQHLKQHGSEADAIITIKPDATVECLQYLSKSLENVLFLREENRGRDIRPFLKALVVLQRYGYDYGCKIHTKKSPHLGDGASWRDALIDSLLGAESSVDQAVRLFSTEPDIGLLAPRSSLMDLGVKDTHNGNIDWLRRLLYRLGRPDLVGGYDIVFPAGSMYWFRVSALAGLDQLAEDAFELEVGQRDGTLAHAIERIVTLYAWQRGYRTREVQLSEEL
jgi:lipopolysaccharide biosynthesis protein